MKAGFTELTPSFLVPRMESGELAEIFFRMANEGELEQTQGEYHV